MPGYGKTMMTNKKKPMMLAEGTKGKVMHPKMKAQQEKMKMDPEYKSAGGMVYKGR
jgi:hypothetical protein